MAQGKLKVKAKLPQKVKSKTKQKGSAVTKRNSNFVWIKFYDHFNIYIISDRPNQSKKAKREETQKLKQAVSKSLNKAVEAEIRARSSGEQRLSRAQKAVAEHTKKATSSKT